MGAYTLSHTFTPLPGFFLRLGARGEETRLTVVLKHNGSVTPFLFLSPGSTGLLEVGFQDMSVHIFKIIADTFVLLWTLL